MTKFSAFAPHRLQAKPEAKKPGPYARAFYWLMVAIAAAGIGALIHVIRCNL